MSFDNLYKGFEVELFTGTQNSHIGVSDDIEKTFPDFVKEPDNRNVEYITIPQKNYKVIYEQLLKPRRNLSVIGICSIIDRIYIYILSTNLSCILKIKEN